MSKRIGKKHIFGTEEERERPQQRLTYKEIAIRLDIFCQTVEGHLKSIYRKADIHSIFQLIEYSKHTGLDSYITADFIRKGVQIIE
ncbi:helix-turn-helix transcriptional regulator [Candidatus Williamhamiltonella defendens]|uniref:helix-turn-helix transcriptional regulator n=1 Tax=Candidatus Williamhamiltonella defendens TaxID=138072 RepID=UPI00130DF2BE|nr:LuxR C-terminal-related transcriptional regulator [Candidatus Hamiltonella defensa]